MTENPLNSELSYSFLDKLKNLPFVEEMYLYGSRARGDNQPNSDIDLAIVAPTATEDDWVDVTSIIDTADTLLEIDCVRLDRLKDSDPLKQNILRDKKVIYQKRSSIK